MQITCDSEKKVNAFEKKTIFLQKYVYQKVIYILWFVLKNKQKYLHILEYLV